MELRTAFQEKGDEAALEAARDLLNDTQNLALGDRERLFGYLEGSRRVILPEPQALLTEYPKVPGLDGQKMSKSYGNAILMREDPAEVTSKIRTMQTDPARVWFTNDAVPALKHTPPEANPLARVYGEPFNDLPLDLYSPPEALEVFLDSFEGPLDLLLYLIRRQNINVLDIPMAELTKQYLGYVEMMRRTQLELAAEYLLMAAVLIEIKSRLLLPKPPAPPGEEPADPRAELGRPLLQYERMKQAARTLDA